jgi:peptide/nickel transport system substrate-binding protein
LKEDENEMWNKRRFMMMALMVLVVPGFVLAGCGPTASPGPVEPVATAEEATPAEAPSTAPSGELTTLVVGLDFGESTSMDPHAHFEIGGALVNYATYETVVKITADDWHTPVPALAESWDISEDGLTYTFHLQPEAKFASGNQVTAEDVRFSWMRLKNKQGLPSWFALGWIEEVEAVDDLTVKATLLKPSPDFLAVATTPYMSVMDSQVVKENGGTDAEDAPTADAATPWLDQNSAGSGPFILTGWTRRNEIVMEANPNYWGEAPKVDRIVIRQVEDPTTALQMMQRGDMDILFRLDPDLVEDAEADPNLSVQVLKTLDFTHLTMTCNPDLSEPLSDQRVRRAIALAIDRDGMIESALRGYAQKQPSIIPLGMEGVDPAMAEERDLDGARALLADAGYEDGFSITLSYPVAALWDVVAAKIQSDLAEVGITVELNPMDYSLLITETWEERKLPFMFWIWVPDYVDYTAWTEYWSYADVGFGYAAFIDNPELEEAAAAIAAEADHDKLVEAAERWQEIMMEYSYDIPLYQQMELLVMSNDVEGFGYIPSVYTDWGAISK